MTAYVVYLSFFFPFFFPSCMVSCFSYSGSFCTTLSNVLAVTSPCLPEREGNVSSYDQNMGSLCWGGAVLLSCGSQDLHVTTLKFVSTVQ